MSFPASWARIPVTATYLLRDEAGTPATGRIEFRSAQIVVADGSIIVPVRVTATLDSDGHISLSLPATDDPDIQPNSWTWTVTEIIDRQPRRSYSLSVPHTASSIDLSSIAPIPPGQPVYDYLLTSAIGATVAGQGDLDLLDGRVTALEGAGGGVQLSDDTPGSLGTASAGVSTKASRSDHVHEMPTAAQVGALAAGDGLAALDSAAATKLAGIATGATANATDAQLRDRATHIGTQPSTTITGLGDSATRNVGTTSGTVAAGDDARLSDARTPTAHAHPSTDISGLGTAATTDAIDYDPAGSAASAVTAHESAPDPHPQYTTAAEASAAAPVQSVQGQTGAVALTAADVGAATSAQGAKADTALQVESDPTVPAWAKQPSPPSYTAVDVGADPAGTAASAISTHESALDPHPQYLLEATAAAVATSGSYDDLINRPTLKFEFGVLVSRDAGIVTGGYPATRSAWGSMTMSRFFAEALGGAATVMVRVNGALVHGPIAVAEDERITQTVEIELSEGDVVTFDVVAGGATRLSAQIDGGAA